MTGRKKVTDVGDLREYDKAWHVSRGIPLGLIISLASMFLAQTGTALWFFAHQDSRLEAVEKVQTAAQLIGDKLQSTTNALGVQNARLEEKVVSVQASVNRIEALLTAPRSPANTSK